MNVMEKLVELLDNFHRDLSHYDAQFFGVFVALLVIMVAVEIGMISICDYLKEIKKLIEKYVNQEPPKGE